MRYNSPELAPLLKNMGKKYLPSRKKSARRTAHTGGSPISSVSTYRACSFVKIQSIRFWYFPEISYFKVANRTKSDSPTRFYLYIQRSVCMKYHPHHFCVLSHSLTYLTQHIPHQFRFLPCIPVPFYITSSPNEQRQAIFAKTEIIRRIHFNTKIIYLIMTIQEQFFAFIIRYKASFYLQVIRFPRRVPGKSDFRRAWNHIYYQINLICI